MPKHTGDQVIARGLELSAKLERIVPEETSIRTWTEFKAAVSEVAAHIDRICTLTYEDYLQQVASSDRIRQLRGEVASAIAKADQTAERRNRATQYLDEARDRGAVPNPEKLIELVVDLTLSPYVWMWHIDSDPQLARAVGTAILPLTWYDEVGREEFPFADICESVFDHWIRLIPGHVARSLVLSAAVVNDLRPASGTAVTLDEYRMWRWIDSGEYCVWEGWIFASHGTAEAGDLLQFSNSLCGKCRNAVQIAYGHHDLLTLPGDLIADEPNLWLVKLAEQGNYRISTAWAHTLTDALCTSGCPSAPFMASHSAGAIVWSYLNGRYKNCYRFIREISADGSGIDLAPACGALLESIGGPGFARAIEQSRHREALSVLEKQRSFSLRQPHVEQILALAEQGTNPDLDEIDWFAATTTELMAMRSESTQAADLATDLLNSALTHKILSSEYIRSYLGFLNQLFETTAHSV
jgi:hypothetical protein